MNSTSRTSRPRTAPRIGLGALVVFSIVSVANAAPTVSEVRSESKDMSEWIAGMGEYFDAHPELKDTKSSGWKPYNRAKWFYEQRMVNGEEVPFGARWKAWEQKKAIEATRPAPRNSWFALGPTNLSGRILDIKFDPNTPTTVYAATAGGGLWKSTDNGANWLPQTDEQPTLGVGAVCVLPSDPNIVLIGTGEATFNIDRIGGVGILRSTDGGATWGTTSLGFGESSGHGFHCMEVNPLTGTILAGAIDGLWRSTDAGLNWINVRPEGNGTDYYDVAFKPFSSTICYTVKGSASSGNGVKFSTDDGATFATSLGNPVAGIGKSKLAVTPADPARVFCLFSDDDDALGFYTSTNDGVNFALTSSSDIVGAQGWYNLILEADPNNVANLVGGGVNFSRSTNSGSTWSGTGTGVHVDMHAIAYKPGSPNEIWVGGDGGIWSSATDGANPWTDKNTNLVTYQFYDICVSQQTTTFIMGGTQDQGTDRWVGSTAWLQGLGADGMVCNINPNSESTVYAEIQFGDHRKSTNAGANFFSINTGIPANNNQWVVPVAEDQSTPNHLYTSHSGSGAYRTTNGGTNWANVVSGSSLWIDISPIDGNYVFLLSGSVRISTNDGTNWAPAAAYGFPTGGPTKILADPVDLNTVYVTFSGYSTAAHVARSTNLGASWTDISSNLPQVPLNAIAVDPEDTDRIFVGSDVGVWETTDSGGSWHPFETGFPNSVVVDLEIQKSGRKLIAGTHGRGAWEVDITADGGTGVDVATPASLNLMLDPPSPNPASRETTLRFAAKHMGEVTLQVFDVTGRQVSELVRAPVGDGIIRMVPWLTDDVPSGVYFAVLKAGSEQLSQKIVVTK